MALPVLSKTPQDDAQHVQQSGERELHPATACTGNPGDKPEPPLHVNRGAIRASSPDPSLISIDDSNNIRLGRSPDYLPAQHGRTQASRSPAPPRTILARLHLFWVTNKGLALVLIAQLFGTLMNVTTRILEMEGNDGTASLVHRHCCK
tara:strand:- start:21982 stop:22428 length:447 start_codon:yes stop_codon:yes gene_type:complete